MSNTIVIDKGANESVSQAAISANIATNKAAQTLGYKNEAELSALAAAAFASQIASLFDYTGTAKLLDIIQRGPVIDARAHGVKCDGVTDDTAALQAILDLVGGSLADYQAGIYKGGKILIPGVCRITAPIYIGPNTKLIGLGSTSWRASYLMPHPSGSVIYCDFTNTEQYAVNVSGWVTATGQRHTSYYSSGTSFDSGTITFTDNVEIENIAFYTTQDIAIGLRLCGAGRIKLRNVASVNFRNGVVASSCWGGSAKNIFVLAKHSGFSLLDACNGFSLRDSYINKTGNLTMDSSNKIITRCDASDGTLYARTGIYSCFSNVVDFNNVITELWDRYYRVSRNDAMSIRNAYMEGNTANVATNCFDITQSTYNIDSFWVFCSSTTTNVLRDTGASVGKLSNIAKVNTSGTQYATFATSEGFSTIDATSCSIPDTQKPVSGIKMFTHTSFYVDTSTGNNANSGTQNAPFATITKALDYIVANNIKQASIYLQGGQTFSVGYNTTVDAGTILSIKSYGTGNAVVASSATSGFINMVRLYNNVSVSFDTVTLQIANGTYNTSQRGILYGYGSNININFKNCLIQIGAGGALFQPGNGLLAAINTYYTGCTIDGYSSTYGYLSLPISGSMAKMVITDYSYGHTINATIKTQGYSGSTIIHSDLLT
ncbi:MAG: Pectate lyase superfamily protein [Caproiciproducens sp.]|jgi:hypothetical protein|nr:Pectate lyase superfamily protein [Caproiciproducens sp.]